MEQQKILSANMLDILFDGRNKSYGAYMLRKTYNRRMSKALLLTGALCLTIFAGAKLVNHYSPAPIDDPNNKSEVVIREIHEDEKKDEPKPIEIKKEEPVTNEKQEVEKVVEAMSKQFTTIVITKEVDKAVATIDELNKVKISLFDNDNGPNNPDFVIPEKIGQATNGIVQAKKTAPGDDIWTGSVEVEAQYPGGPAAWKRFLERNLDAAVAPDNGAPVGTYTVWIQFVVDKEGKVSDIKALTEHGYGMEKEAIRVFQKALKWIPAIQNGFAVKAYRKQPIIFQVQE